MDVGLNNRNTLGEVAPELKDVVFLVEANSNERLQLWSDWSDESIDIINPFGKEVMDSLAEAVKSWPVLNQVESFNHGIMASNSIKKRVQWKQVSAGFLKTIGHIKSGREKLPVSVEFSFAFINGKKVCFYNCCSRAADHTMIHDWFIERFQLTHDGYTRWNHTDAGNFHNCINSLDDLDKKPRKTKYKK
jgi:hypothetical protein